MHRRERVAYSNSLPICCCHALCLYSFYLWSGGLPIWDLKYLHRAVRSIQIQEPVFLSLCPAVLFFPSSCLHKGGAKENIWLILSDWKALQFYYRTKLLWTAQDRNTLWYGEMYLKVCLQCLVRAELEYLNKPFEACSCLSSLSSKALVQDDWSCCRLCELITSTGELLSSNWNVH